MSDGKSQVSAFIWYHAEIERQPELLAWLEQVRQKTGVQGRLLVRRQTEQTTFMEIYDPIEPDLISRIEQMAATSPCFSGIQRRCECFMEAPPSESHAL